jgi:diacylglycerol kinase family enzyme
VHRGLDALEIQSRASRLRVALDGEVTILEPPLRYRTRPRALRVFAPVAAEQRG